MSTPFGANRDETEVYLCHRGNHRHMDRGDAYRSIRAKFADQRDWGNRINDSGRCGLCPLLRRRRHRVRRVLGSPGTVVRRKQEVIIRYAGP